MRPSAPLISVVIPTWNGRRFLGPCIDSLLRQTYPAVEIVVVDNGSTDGSVPFLEDAYGSTIVLVKNSRNEGFAGGVNAGIRASRGTLVALLNNDAVADPRWLEELSTGLHHGQGVGMCASKIVRLDEPNRIDKAGHLMYPDGLNAGRGLGEPDLGQYDTAEEVLFPDGCAALYSRHLLEDVGLFDEQFFAYGDDAELGIRARLRGWRCVYVPTAVVHHEHAGTFRQFSPLRAMLIERNRLWLAVKCFPVPLLLLTPAFTLARFFWNAYAALTGTGSAGDFARRHSRMALLGTLARAYASAMAGLPSMIRKRREIRRRRRLSDADFYQLLRRHRISARDLTLRDR